MPQVSTPLWLITLRLSRQASSIDQGRHDQLKPVYFFGWIDDTDEVSKRPSAKDGRAMPEEINSRFHMAHPNVEPLKGSRPQE